MTPRAFPVARARVTALTNWLQNHRSYVAQAADTDILDFTMGMATIVGCRSRVVCISLGVVGSLAGMSVIVVLVHFTRASMMQRTPEKRVQQHGYDSGETNNDSHDGIRR